MSESRRPGRYPLNVVGDFFVEHECCTMCGVPEMLAPDLFSSDQRQCFVRKQPGDEREHELMYKVLAAQELDCIFYAGSEERVLQRVKAIDEGRHVLPE